MRSLVRGGLFLVCLTLVACGGRPLASGKEAAAGALFHASRGASSAPGGLATLFAQNVAPVASIQINCPRGGSVAFRFDAESGSTAEGLTYQVEYQGCSFDGQTSLRGTLTMTLSAQSSGTDSASMALTIRGRVDFWGEVSDYIQVDVTELVSLSDLSSPTASISISLDGTIQNSTGVYTFDNETIVIDGMAMQRAPDPS
jgi:hypothetical protein